MTTHSFRERAWPFLRLATGVLIIAAVLAQLVRTVQIAQAAETPHGSHVPTVLSNFFSFFTIQSNVLAAAVLIISALWWYPYPFLNPHGPGGNADVIFYIVVIALTIALVAWGVVALGRRRGSVRD